MYVCMDVSTPSPQKHFFLISLIPSMILIIILFMTREGKSMNEERALAYANKVYRTMKVEPLAKSSVETRRIRDVFFEKR